MYNYYFKYLQNSIIKKKWKKKKIKKKKIKLKKKKMKRKEITLKYHFKFIYLFIYL